MSFPLVTLPVAHIAQTEYSSTSVRIIQVDDSLENKSLRVFVQLGDNPSFKYWIPVQSGDAYTTDWTNDNIVAAIQGYFANA